MKNGFDVISIGIQNKGGIVTRAIAALARAAVICPASCQSGFVETSDCRAVGHLRNLTHAFFHLGHKKLIEAKVMGVIVS